MILRLRSERGFGLIELLMAMVMLNIGVLAIVAAFNSGMFALNRASQISTASALADSQMELPRDHLQRDLARLDLALERRQHLQVRQRPRHLVPELDHLRGPSVLLAADQPVHPEPVGHGARPQAVPRGHLHRLRHADQWAVPQGRNGRRAQCERALC